MPACLTSSFPSEATRYAAIWREISANATPEQLAELETMICEGLLRSVGGIQPTPTINPNLNVPATPTPVDAAPVTTGGGDQAALDVVAIDIETGQRSRGNYLPPPIDSDFGASLAFSDLQAAYRSQFNTSPNSLVISPDGWLAAERDDYGFITVYRLGRNFNDMAAQREAAATQSAQSRHSIGLDPTATVPFEALGGIRPTITPTATIAAPTLVSATAVGWVGDGITNTAICPSRTIYTLDNPPPDYAASGRILGENFLHGVDTTWVVEPATGRQYGDASIPQPYGGIAYSLDHQWMAYIEDGGVFVSRLDGSQRVTVVPPHLPHQPQFDLSWDPDNTLYLAYQGYLNGNPNPQMLFYPVDLLTGQLGDPILPFDRTHPVEIGELPIQSVTSQPGGMLALVTTPVVGGGEKYWLYNRETGEAVYFAQNLDWAEWEPFGRALYYGSRGMTYVYEVTTGQHAVIPSGLGIGDASPDGNFLADYVDYLDENYTRIDQGELPFKLQVWNRQTGETRAYCVPGMGWDSIEADSILWSPDGRYLAFIAYPPIEGDFFPTPGPTAVPYTPQPGSTEVPLELQYQSQFPHLYILDTVTGYVTEISQQTSHLSAWVGSQGGEQ
ncbi:MAG: hypothetical protein U0670_01675 [Anaerolineae bacterium]